MRSRLLVLALAGSILALPGCGSGGLQLPTDPAGTALFEQGQQHLEEEDWSDAVQAFDTLLRNYPTSPHLADARLGLGRAYYEQGRSDKYLLAIEAFRNYLTYHPSATRTDYAQLMVAMSYRQMMRAPDRDQAHARQALAAFRIFLEDYPDSPHREFALEHMQVVVDNLAEHELGVAEWQLDNDHFEAAEVRARYALQKYPGTQHRCDLLWVVAESLRRRNDPEGAAVYYRQVIEDHPDCERARDARERMDRIQQVGGR